jgi:hypothetical protein
MPNIAVWTHFRRFITYSLSERELPRRHGRPVLYRMQLRIDIYIHEKIRRFARSATPARLPLSRSRKPVGEIVLTAFNAAIICLWRISDRQRSST